MDRYAVVLTRDGRKFGILDREQYDYCSLRAEDGRPLPLEWTVRAAAEAWLVKCYQLWQSWEGSGEGRPPKDWRPGPRQKLSPFDRGYRFYN